MGRTTTLRTLTTCLWPGLAPLWWRGNWSGLAAALAFAVGLNLLLTATFVWPEWLERPWPTLGWFALSGVWLFACWRNWRKLPTLVDNATDNLAHSLFVEAQHEYLKGNWYDAEVLIQRLLARRPRDIEGRLLLATLLRHTRRLDEAIAVLDALERLNGSARWFHEIARERQRISSLKAESSPAESPQNVAA
jgi:hypothetical protein